MPTIKSLLSALTGPTAKNIGKNALGIGGGAGLGYAENKLIYEPLARQIQGDDTATSSPVGSHLSVLLGALAGRNAATGGLSRALNNYIPKVTALSAAEAGVQGVKGFMRDAPVRKETAELNRAAASDNRATEAMKLDQAGSWTTQDKIMAALAAAGIGAAGIYGYNSLKGKRKGAPTTKEVLKGDPAQRRKQKLRIDVPADSLPPEFFQSLIDADGRERALTTLQTKSARFEFEVDRSDVVAGIHADLNELFSKRATIDWSAPQDQRRGQIISSAKNLGGTIARPFQKAFNWGAGKVNAAGNELASRVRSNIGDVGAMNRAGPSGYRPNAAPSPVTAPPPPAAPAPRPLTQPAPYTGPMSRNATPAAAPWQKATGAAPSTPTAGAPWQQAAGISPTTPAAPARPAPTPAAAPAVPAQPAAPSNGMISYQSADGTMKTINNANNMSSGQIQQNIRASAPKNIKLPEGVNSSRGPDGHMTYSAAPTSFANGLPTAGNQNSALRNVTGAQMEGAFKANPALRPTNPAGTVGAQMSRPSSPASSVGSQMRGGRR